MDFILDTLANLGLTVTNLKYLSIPFISSISGWLTNWLAIQLSFYPVEFVGFKPFFGWQGIIPAKSQKMSSIFISKSLLHMGSLADVFEKFELEKLAVEFTSLHSDELNNRVDQMMESIAPIAWHNAPKIAKSIVYERLKQSIPHISEGVAKDITKNIDYFIDIRKLMIDHLTKDKQLLMSLIKDVGKKEIDFAINSGLVFGFLFGIIQMLTWYHYPYPTVLPFFGILVGTATNWLVLNMIFRPLNPVKVLPQVKMGNKRWGPFYLQGLFIKRQHQVAQSFSTVVTEKLLTVSHVMQEVFNGKHKNEARGIIKKHLKPYIESHRIKALLQTTKGFRGYAAIKEEIEEQALAYFMESLDSIDSDTLTAIKAQPFFIEKVKSLPPEDYQDMLRPAFQEDEWILILVGGILGGLVGFLQYAYMFS